MPATILRRKALSAPAAIEFGSPVAPAPANVREGMREFRATRGAAGPTAAHRGVVAGGMVAPSLQAPSRQPLATPFRLDREDRIREASFREAWREAMAPALRAIGILSARKGLQVTVEGEGEGIALVATLPDGKGGRAFRRPSEFLIFLAALK